MRKRLLISVLCSVIFYLFCCLPLHSSQYYDEMLNDMVNRLVQGSEGKPVSKVTVINFVESPYNIRRDFSKILELDLTHKLINNPSKKFTIVESNREDILNEIKRQVSTIFDPANSAKFGRLLGADAIVTGTYRAVGNHLIIYVQLIAVETGIAYCGTEQYIPIEALPSGIRNSWSVNNTTPPGGNSYSGNKEFFLNSSPFFGQIKGCQIQKNARFYSFGLRLPRFIPGMFGFKSENTNFCTAINFSETKPWESIFKDYDEYAFLNLNLRRKELRLQLFMHFDRSFPMFVNYRRQTIEYLLPNAYSKFEPQKVSVGFGYPDEQSYYTRRFANKASTEHLYLEADVYPLFSGVYFGYKFALSRLFSPYLKIDYIGQRWQFDYPNNYSSQYQDDELTHFRILEVAGGSDIKLFYRIRGFVGIKYQEFNFVSAEGIEKSNFDSIANSASTQHKLKRKYIYFGLILMF